MTVKRLPVLFLSDVVLLPGMVVPIELDEAARAAVDAAQAASSDDGELLVAPRLDDRYASYGVVATVEKVGRFRGGAPAAVLRTGGKSCRVALSGHGATADEFPAIARKIHRNPVARALLRVGDERLQRAISCHGDVSGPGRSPVCPSFGAI